MRLTRSFVVTMVTVILLAMTAPATQARAIEKPQSVLPAQGGAWLDLALDNAMTWLTRLAGGEPAASSGVSSRPMSSTTPLPPPPGTGGHYTPMGGPCIDPMGVGRCN